MNKNRIIHLYRATCLINNKIYIGQSVDPEFRWMQHKYCSKNPKTPFHYAIQKHGIDNFNFEIIASCISQDDANFTETQLVEQYNSYISNGCGYNATYGGANAPKSDLWRLMMKSWHASLSTEEKERRSIMLRNAINNYIENNGHPSLNKKRTPEQIEKLKIARKKYPVIYTDEIRKKMSDSQIKKGIPIEQKEKMILGVKEAWRKKNEIRFSTGEIKCQRLAAMLRINQSIIYLMDLDIAILIF